MLDRLKQTKAFIKWTNWEYWPTWLAYLPVLPVVLYYVFKTRRWFFFSNVNPLFKTGALMGASKYQILEQIPDAYKPITLYIGKNENSVQGVLELMREKNLEFPVIAKPDVGERGLLVALIESEQDLKRYLKANSMDILIQEYIDLPKECGIFYIRKPSEAKGKVVSVGLKDYMKLTGDGKSTVRELMENSPKFKLQVDRLLEEGRHDILTKVLGEEEFYQPEPIGNHCRGATFIDGTHLIEDRLNELFNEINQQMNEVYYGRFDVKYSSWENLLEGRDIKILEMNGIASEPIHIYDNRVRIRDKYKSFYELWKSIYEISDIQKSRGIHPISLWMAFQAFREYKNYMKSLNSNWKNTNSHEFSVG